MHIISDTDHINTSEFEEFVNNHPHGSFFQSTGAYNFFQSVDFFTPILIVAMEENEIVGSLLAIIVKEGGGLSGYFSRRCIIWGHPQ